MIVRNLKKILVKKQEHKKQNATSEMMSSICAQSLHALALHLASAFYIQFSRKCIFKGVCGNVCMLKLVWPFHA